jgi:hypothetical protein
MILIAAAAVIIGGSLGLVRRGGLTQNAPVMRGPGRAAYHGSYQAPDGQVISGGVIFVRDDGVILVD